MGQSYCWVIVSAILLLPGCSTQAVPSPAPVPSPSTASSTSPLPTTPSSSSSGHAAPTKKTPNSLEGLQFSPPFVVLGSGSNTKLRVFPLGISSSLFVEAEFNNQRQLFRLDDGNWNTDNLSAQGLPPSTGPGTTTEIRWLAGTWPEQTWLVTETLSKQGISQQCQLFTWQKDAWKSITTIPSTVGQCVALVVRQPGEALVALSTTSAFVWKSFGPQASSHVPKFPISPRAKKFAHSSEIIFKAHAWSTGEVMVIGQFWSAPKSTIIPNVQVLKWSKSMPLATTTDVIVDNNSPMYMEIVNPTTAIIEAPGDAGVPVRKDQLQIRVKVMLNRGKPSKIVKTPIHVNRFEDWLLSHQRQLKLKNPLSKLQLEYQEPTFLPNNRLIVPLAIKDQHGKSFSVLVGNFASTSKKTFHN
jgi:hypothetical protein